MSNQKPTKNDNGSSFHSSPKMQDKPLLVQRVPSLTPSYLSNLPRLSGHSTESDEVDDITDVLTPMTELTFNHCDDSPSYDRPKLAQLDLGYNQTTSCSPSDTIPSSSYGTDDEFNDSYSRTHSLQFAASDSSSEDSESEDSEFSFDLLDMLSNDDEMDENIFLAESGYTVIRKLCDTLQGELLLASNKSGEQVAIKKIDVKLHQNKEAHFRDEFDDDDDEEDDGMTYLVDKDVAAEAVTLKKLSADPKMSRNVVQFVDYLKSDAFLYLVTEHIDGVSLDQFIKSAFEYIDAHKLDRSQWAVTVQHIVSQIISTIHHLHSTHRCCHLDLWAENIMIYGASFVEHDDGSVTIEGTVNVKFVDFGVAQMFDAPTFSTTRVTADLFHEIQQSPESQECDTFDASAADMWSIGMVLFEAMTGRPLFSTVDDDAYDALETDTLSEFLSTPQLDGVFGPQAMSLLLGLLQIQPESRLDASEAVQHC